MRSITATAATNEGEMRKDRWRRKEMERRCGILWFERRHDGELKREEEEDG